MKMKKTVLLVQPDKTNLKPRIPLGLLYPAYMLQKSGFRPKILDLRVDDYKSAKIDWGDVVCVGLSVYTGPSILHALEFARHARKVAPDVPIVWGGIHPSMMPEQTAENELVDFVVRKDGEETIVELAKALQGKKPVDNIKGITYKKNGKVVSNPDREWFDLNKVAHLPYEILDIEKYNIAEFPMNTSRGCPFRCIFCYNLIYNQGSFRSKDAKGVVNEIEYVLKKYKPKTINFVDDNFFTNRKRVEEICREIIRRKLKVRWISSIRADYLARYDDEFMRLLKKSGLVMVWFGAESGNDRVLKLIGKGTTVKDNIEAVKKLEKHGIVGRISFVWGSPTETRDETMDSVEMIKEFRRICPEVIINGIFVSTVYPNTPLFDIALKMNPEFTIPGSLEEWGHWQHYQTGFQPWLTKEYSNEMQTVSEIVRFQCIKDMKAENYLKQKWLLLAFKAATTLFNISASLRWRFNFYKFGYEWRLWSYLTYKYMGNI